MATTTQAATATTTQAQVKIRPSKIKTLSIDPRNLSFYVDHEFILAMDKTNDNALEVIGIIDPKDFSDYIQQYVACIPKKAEPDITLKSPGFLPKNTIYYENITRKDSTKNIYIFGFEFDPCIVPITYYPGKSSEVDPKKVRIYDLSMPFVQFFITIQEYKGIYSVTPYCYVTCSQKPISKDTELYELPLNNIYHGGQICWGSNPLPFDGSKDTLPSYARKLASSFFALSFNADIVPHALRGFDISLPKWEEATKSDPSFILRVPLNQNHFIHVHTLINSIKSGISWK